MVSMKKFACFLVLLFPLLAFAQANDAKPAPSYEAGRDYLVLPVSKSTDNFNLPNKVTVIEFFSYGCPACFRFNPTLEKWLKDKPAIVNFERVPVVFESDWHLYARAYYVAKINKIQAEVSPALFSAIQTEHVDLGTPERMAEFFQKNFKIKKDVFMNTYESPVVDAQLANDQKIMNDFMVFQVPGIVIDGKYKVDPSLAGNNPQHLVDTINYLIEKEKKAKKI
jgi:thiol:disulfide interchange protein DsbA